MKEGDVANVDLIAHIDGEIAFSEHTVYIITKPDEKITGKEANVKFASHAVKEAFHITIILGNKNNQVIEVINKGAEEYGCKIVK